MNTTLTDGEYIYLAVALALPNALFLIASLFNLWQLFADDYHGGDLNKTAGSCTVYGPEEQREQREARAEQRKEAAKGDGVLRYKLIHRRVEAEDDPLQTYLSPNHTFLAAWVIALLVVLIPTIILFNRFYYSAPSAVANEWVALLACAIVLWFPVWPVVAFLIAEHTKRVLQRKQRDIDHPPQ